MIDEKDKSIKLKLRFISYKIKYRKVKVAVKRKITDTFSNVGTFFYKPTLKEKPNSKLQSNTNKETVNEKRLSKSKPVKKKLDDKKIEIVDNKIKETKNVEKIKITKKKVENSDKKIDNDKLNKKVEKKSISGNKKSDTSQAKKVNKSDSSSKAKKDLNKKVQVKSKINTKNNDKELEEKKELNIETKSNNIGKFISLLFKNLLLIISKSIKFCKYLLLKLMLLIKKYIRKVFSKSKDLMYCFDFSNIKSKLKKAFLVCFVLGIIGGVTYCTRRILNAPSALTKRYYSEIINNIGIDYSNIVKIIKADINSDGMDDYICLTGQSVYGATKAYIGNDNITGYKNVGIVCIDGNSKEKITYESEFLFYTDVDIKVLNDSNGTYIFVNSVTSQDVIFAKVTSEGLFDIVKNTFLSLPKGYNISCRISDEDDKKLIIGLDKDENEYLADKKDEYVVDLEQKGINIKSYRYSYLKDKFSYFECYDIDYDGTLDLIGVQNILYSNSKLTSKVKTLGKLKVIFKLSEDKLVYSDVRMEF